MLKILLLAASFFFAVGMMIVAKSPRLTVRRVISALSLIAFGLAIILMGMGKFSAGLGSLSLALAGLFSLRFVGMSEAKR